MRFVEFLLLLETQTISQYLKTVQIPPEPLKNLKSTIRLRLSNIPFFAQQGKRYLDLFVNFFTYIGIENAWPHLKGRLVPRSIDGPSEEDVISALANNKDNIAGFFVGYASNFNNEWQRWGDYIVSHADDSHKMSLFNTIDYTPKQIDKDVEDWHERLALKQARPGAPGRTIIDLSNIGWPGWKWVSLDRASCRQEGDAAGHCGNSAGNKDDNILSLRDSEDKVHLTFIVNKKILGESKGRGNSKPTQKYHPPIVQLLLSPYVDFIKGGGYMPQSNFMFSDLDKTTQEQITAAKPSIGMNYFDYVISSQRGNLKTKIGNIINHDVKKVYRLKKNILVVLETFENFSEIYDFIGGKDNFSWIDEPFDIFPDYPGGEIEDLLNYVPDDVVKAIEKYLGDDDEDLTLAEKIEQSDLRDAFRSANWTGYEVGTANEAYEDVKRQLSNGDKNGYFIEFDKHPYELTIGLSSLKDIYNDYSEDMEIGNNWIEKTIGIKYHAPYYGYNDFSKEAFLERLIEELPKEVHQLIPKKKPVSKKKFKEWQDWIDLRDII